MCITLRLLTSADVDDLYPRLRLEDAQECIVLGSNPREALLMGAFDNVFAGISKGRAYALVDSNAETDESSVIGAIGFTTTGFLWALSTKFTTTQLRELFKKTPEITFRLLYEAMDRGAIAKDEHLGNFIYTKNKVALKWLKASKCFDILEDEGIDIGSELFYSFRSKPLEECMRACASPS